MARRRWVSQRQHLYSHLTTGQSGQRVLCTVHKLRTLRPAAKLNKACFKEATRATGRDAAVDAAPCKPRKLYQGLLTNERGCAHTKKATQPFYNAVAYHGVARLTFKWYRGCQSTHWTSEGRGACARTLTVAVESKPFRAHHEVTSTPFARSLRVAARRSGAVPCLCRSKSLAGHVQSRQTQKAIQIEQRNFDVFV